MADIFGREPGDYEVVRFMQDEGVWDEYQRQEAETRAYATGHHDWDALGSWSGGVPAPYERATQDAQAVGFVTNNLLSIQTFVDEILYTRYRLPDFIAMNTNIEEGARTYGLRVLDRVGKAKRITAPGFDAPSATRAQAFTEWPLHWYGLDAEWSLDELRGAMFAGLALDTESIDAAVVGTMETMEEVGLTGGDYGDKGLFNLPITGTGAVTYRLSTVEFSASDAIEVRTILNAELSGVISLTKETVGRDIVAGMGIYLPGEQYDGLTNSYVGDNADKTLMDAILRDNPWTHFSGEPLMIHRAIELSGIGAGDTDRMVVAMKNNRVAEMGVSISPRVLTVLPKGRVICAQVEAKFSPLFVKRANVIRYVDGI